MLIDTEVYWCCKCNTILYYDLFNVGQFSYYDPLLTYNLQVKLFTYQMQSNDGGWFR